MNAVALRAATQRFAWVERRLFEVLGGWVPTVAESEVKLALRSHSFHHAWHAELWDGIAPRSAVPVPTVGVGDGGDEAWEALLDALAAPAGTVDRLAGAYRVVLPRLIEAYRALREGGGAAAGGPLARVLDLMLADDERDTAEGLRLLGEVQMAAAASGGGGSHEQSLRGLLAEIGAVRVSDDP